MLIILINITAPDLFRQPYCQADSAYGWMFSDTMQGVIRTYGLPDSCEETLKKAYFLHLLLQGEGLGVGYVWMNQRETLMFRRMGDEWVDLDSINVKGHRIIQRASAVDRIPRLFFLDLLSEDTLPPYLCQWDSGPELYYTFGWCSELEMAYAVALSWFGIAGRVVFTLRYTRKPLSGSRAGSFWLTILSRRMRDFSTRSGSMQSHISLIFPGTRRFSGSRLGITRGWGRRYPKVADGKSDPSRKKEQGRSWGWNE